MIVVEMVMVTLPYSSTILVVTIIIVVITFSLVMH